MKNNTLTVIGRNAVIESIKSGHDMEKIYVQDQAAHDQSVKKIMAMAKDSGILVNVVKREKLDQLAEGGKHQGVVAVVSAFEYVEVDDILAIAEDKGEPPFLLLLDGIEDPHNLGAIIRTANIAGVHGIIIPKRRAVGLTATVAKTSAGAIEYTPVARVTNMARTIEDLKKQGIWFACADMDGQEMFKSDLKGPLGLVIGSEGKGVSRLVQEKCDFTVSIPMKGEITSLNASVAAGILVYEAFRQRLEK